MITALVAEARSADVSYGLGAFLAFFFLAVCLWLLMRNMNSRLRRMSYRRQAEVAEVAEAAEVVPTPDGPTPEQSAGEAGHRE